MLLMFVGILDSLKQKIGMNYEKFKITATHHKNSQTYDNY